MLLIATLFAFLLAGQQQQVADAWWPFTGEPTQASAGPAPRAAQAQAAAAAAATATATAYRAPADPTGALKAVAKFDLDGVKGAFRFSQKSPSEPTLVEYDLSGLKGNNKLYHVHVRPVPKFEAEKVRNNASAIAQLCGDPATGGHLNPHHITEKLPAKSAPLDKYELGDLSGKHGPLAEAGPQQADRYLGSFRDDKLPMSGVNSIVGRSLVIHKNGGARWVCASIEPSS